jgi:hypothetical protein
MMSNSSKMTGDGQKSFGNVNSYLKSRRSHARTERRTEILGFLDSSLGDIDFNMPEQDDDYLAQLSKPSRKIATGKKEGTKRKLKKGKKKLEKAAQKIMTDEKHPSEIEALLRRCSKMEDTGHDTCRTMDMTASFSTLNLSQHSLSSSSEVEAGYWHEELLSYEEHNEKETVEEELEELCASSTVEGGCAEEEVFFDEEIVEDIEEVSTSSYVEEEYFEEELLSDDEIGVEEEYYDEADEYEEAYYNDDEDEALYFDEEIVEDSEEVSASSYVEEEYYVEEEVLSDKDIVEEQYPPQLGIIEEEYYSDDINSEEEYFVDEVLDEESVVQVHELEDYSDDINSDEEYFVDEVLDEESVVQVHELEEIVEIEEEDYMYEEDLEEEFIEESIIHPYEVPTIPVLVAWQEKAEISSLKEGKRPEVAPRTPRNVMMAIIASAATDFKLRVAPEEHKKKFVSVADSAACMGRLAKLHEKVVEAVGTRIEKEVAWSPSAEPIVLVRSKNIRIVNEAAAMGKVVRLNAKEYTHYDSSQEKYQEEENIDIDDQVDGRGRRVFRTTLLVQNHVRDYQKDTVAKDWMLEILEDSEQTNYIGLDNVKLPTTNLPQFKPAETKLSRQEINEAIARGVAERAWDRKYRLERPKRELRVTQKCRCSYCEHPNAFQTYAYRRLREQSLQM